MDTSLLEGLDGSGTLRLALMSPGLSLGTQALMWIWAELNDLILNKVRSDTTSESHLPSRYRANRADLRVCESHNRYLWGATTYQLPHPSMM